MKRLTPHEAQEQLASAARAHQRLDPGSVRSYARAELGSSLLQFGVFLFFALVFAFDWTLTTVILVVVLALAVSVPIQRSIVRNRKVVPREVSALDRFVRGWTPIMVIAAAAVTGAASSFFDVVNPLSAAPGTGAGVVGFGVILALGILVVVPRVILGLRLWSAVP